MKKCSHWTESHTWPVRGATTKAPNQISDYEDEEELEGERETDQNKSSNDIDESDDENNDDDDEFDDNHVRSTSSNWAVGVPPSAGRNTLHHPVTPTTESSSWRNRARNSNTSSSITASSSFILILILLLLPNSVNFFNHIFFNFVPYFSH